MYSCIIHASDLACDSYSLSPVCKNPIVPLPSFPVIFNTSNLSVGTASADLEAVPNWKPFRYATKAVAEFLVIIKLPDELSFGKSLPDDVLTLPLISFVDALWGMM